MDVSCRVKLMKAVRWEILRVSIRSVSRNEECEERILKAGPSGVFIAEAMYGKALECDSDC